MPDRTREMILSLDLAAVTFVSDQCRADSMKGAASPAGSLPSVGGAGVVLTETTVGTAIEARTANNVYRLTHTEQGVIEISGHPQYCPYPVSVALGGARWLDHSTVRPFLAPGMSIQFADRKGRSVLTSIIQSVQVLS